MTEKKQQKGGMMKDLISITIRKPDDMHVHFREGQMMINIMPFTTSVFARAVVMGNLPTPIRTDEDVEWYKPVIKKQAPDFEPIMSIMLINRTTPGIIKDAHRAGAKVLKLIPGNTSTNSAEGVPLENLTEFYPALETVRDLDMIFSGHWELSIMPFDKIEIPELERETAALPYLGKLVNDIPGLKIVVEHVSTRSMIEFVEQAPENVAATITIHHAILSSKDVLGKDGKIANPHHYCKPIAKAKTDRQATVEAMVSNNPKFFFGSDSAPHLIAKKECDNPAAGIFTAPIALPLLCEIFEAQKSLDKLEDFVSKFGARRYGLDLNEERITIRRDNWTVPDQYKGIKLFMGGKRLHWRVA